MDEASLGMVGIGIVGVAVIGAIAFGDAGRMTETVAFGTAVCGMIAALVRGFGGGSGNGS